jgi:hypothetical protein
MEKVRKLLLLISPTSATHQLSLIAAKHCDMFDFMFGKHFEWDINIVACFPHAGTVEAQSLETGTQQKKNKCL